MLRVALIGAGNMGSAMLKGWLRAGVVSRDEVSVTDKDEAKAREASSAFGVREVAGNRRSAAGARTVVLAVKPQDSAGVLEGIAPEMGAGKTLVSIVAGLSIASIREKIGRAPGVVRVMPNMGARVGAAVSGYAVDAGEGGVDSAEAVGLLEAIGEAVEVEEGELDLVTAVSGSGPAYYFLLTEALEKAAVEAGMSAETARLLAGGTMWGAAKVLRESGMNAGELREAVSSPGGTTLAALREMRDAGFEEMIGRAVEAARRRAGELTS